MSEPLTTAAPAAPAAPAVSPPEQAPATPEHVELIAAAVRALPGVADLTGGRFGEYTTYLPGRRLAGVVERDGQVTVAVVAQSGRPLLAVADRIRTAVAAMGATSVEVVIADLDA